MKTPITKIKDANNPSPILNQRLNLRNSEVPNAPISSKNKFRNAPATYFLRDIFQNSHIAIRLIVNNNVIGVNDYLGNKVEIRWEIQGRLNFCGFSAMPGI